MREAAAFETAWVCPASGEVSSGRVRARTRRLTTNARRTPRLGLAASLAAVVALLAPGAAFAAQRDALLARAVSVQGTVESLRSGQSAWEPVRLNDAYGAGDQIRVQAHSRADLALLDRSVLRLNENTTMTVRPVKGAGTGVVDLLRGAVHIFSRGPDSLDVKTPFTVAGVRGTEFLVEVEEERTLLTTFEGTVVAQNDQGSVTVSGGQSAVARRGEAPVLRVVARPRDAVQWALYYPPVVYFRPDEIPDGPGWQGMMRRSLDAYGRGELAQGFEAIVDVPAADVADPRFFSYRAHLLLTVGRAKEANADIDRALALAADDPDALALRTIAAIVQNDPERALRIAMAAVEAAPTSATARVALSYAQQASFELAAARASLERAVELEPANALAWARLAELHSSHGDLASSREAATRAATLNPSLARTQTVLGYAHLTSTELPAATAAFERAIALDSADPLARLGLGLAKIRAGRLDEGARDLEIAASLDPGNPIVRSYLGKAYYEEKRTGLDEREYQAASEVDPKDPTPWFYGAIAKQTANRPVEALQDLERAMELNDNRAVYRSRLLLDSDVAARSASLARIYSDLGFQQLALVEGWRSVDADPTNFSAHRFLADSYSALPRHEIARVSELLQAQLLQPLNLTPIQPQLGESNLFLVGASGPGGLAYNEFNPIFHRDGIVVQPGALGGSNGLFAGETVAAALRGNAAISAGYSHFQTDGFRVNADQADEIANGFVQYEVSDRTSVQAEYRYRRDRRGDVLTRLFPEDFAPELRIADETHGVRLGGRHAVSAGSIVLGSFMYRDGRDVERDTAPAIPFFASSELRQRQRAFSAEVQHLFRSRAVNLATGVGYFELRGHMDSTAEIDSPPPPFGPGRHVDHATIPLDRRHLNAYAYSYLNPVRQVTLTLGVSYDRLTGEREVVPRGKAEQLNPKVGIAYTPIRGTTLRAAALRTLKRTLLTDQTLEPTQAAGFNQFFDDFDATTGWRYGGAIDQRLVRWMFAGAEYSRRDLTIPDILLGGSAGPVNREVDARERLARAYLFAAPHPWLAARAEYVYERLEHGAEIATAVPLDVTTHRVPLGAGLFHPSGIGASAVATYFRQQGEFLRLRTFDVQPGSSTFWLLDASVTYRLPRRYGIAAIGVRNLLDRHFDAYGTDRKNSTIQPGRTLFGNVILAFP